MGTELEPSQPVFVLQAADSRRLRGILCRHAAVQRDRSVQVDPSDHRQSSVHPGGSDRRMEGDMGEERPHLLVPDIPAAAARPRNDNNAEESQRERLQMVTHVMHASEMCDSCV